VKIDYHHLYRKSCIQVPYELELVIDEVVAECPPYSKVKARRVDTPGYFDIHVEVRSIATTVKITGVYATAPFTISQLELVLIERFRSGKLVSEETLCHHTRKIFRC